MRIRVCASYDDKENLGPMPEGAVPADSEMMRRIENKECSCGKSTSDGHAYWDEVPPEMIVKIRRAILDLVKKNPERFGVVETATAVIPKTEKPESRDSYFRRAKFVCLDLLRSGQLVRVTDSPLSKLRIA